MAKLFVAGALIAGLVLAQPATASPRETLPGFNGVPFKTPYAEAQRQLGSSYEEGSRYKRENLRLKTLSGDMQRYGRTFRAVFIFGEDGGLSRVNLGDRTVMFQKMGRDACRVQWDSASAAVIGEYGKPDTTTDRAGGQVMVFRFADGNDVRATYFYNEERPDEPKGCFLFVYYETPQGRDD